MAKNSAYKVNKGPGDFKQTPKRKSYGYDHAPSAANAGKSVKMKKG